MSVAGYKQPCLPFLPWPNSLVTSYVTHRCPLHRLPQFTLNVKAVCVLRNGVTIQKTAVIRTKVFWIDVVHSVFKLC